MHAPEGYTLKDTLRLAAKSEVYLAIRDADATEVVLKRYRTEARPAERSRAARERDALTAASGPGVPRVLELCSDMDPPILVLEHVPGLELFDWARSEPPSVEVLLKLFAQLAEVLMRTHAARLIHQDITPLNIVVAPDTSSAWLVDFGSALPLGTQSRLIDSVANSRDAAGQLHYAAPEQSGRMNRGVDARSDLYSFGACFYFAATGTPPFDESDPLALLHAHMAVRPDPPTAKRADLPVALSRVILKLMEKEPDDRYQSAYGLLADLRTCRKQLAETGEIDPQLALATSEIPSRPRFVRRTYGRQAEVESLKRCFTRAAAGQLQIVLLSGASGAGKSTLVDDLRSEVARRGGYLTSGKFDLSHDRPYSAWTDALAALIDQRLVEPEARLEAWRRALSTNLGGIARAAMDLVPTLGWVLEDAPAMPALGPREAEARLVLALQRFIVTSATPEHPLVVFLDDLQWSDSASQLLLEELIGSSAAWPLLLIGAYRVEEINEEHPLSRLLERLVERGVYIEQISLNALSRKATVEMLSDALERSPEQLCDISEVVERKTNNVPMFVREFVEYLHERGLLHYLPGIGWDWDQAAVASAEIPAAAVALVSAKLHRLDWDVQRTIELASVVGDEFDLDLLCELSSEQSSQLQRHLYVLADAGLIYPCPRGFRFAHDQIREAARELLSPDERSILHYQIAQLLRTRLSKEEQAARVQEIADHLRAGLAHVRDEDRLDAVRVSLEAGRRALETGAATSAESYLRPGRELLQAGDWESDRALACDLFMQSIESAVLRADLEAALAWADRMDQEQLSTIQSARVAAKRIYAFALLRTPEECVTYALEVLQGLGIRWPLEPSRARARWSVRVALWQLRLRGFERALRPATKPDARRIAIMLVIGMSGPSLVRVSANLAALAAAWVMRANLRSGAVARPAYSLGVFATYLQFVLGAFRWAQRVEKVARAQPDLSQDPIYWPRFEMQNFAQLRPWWMRRRAALAQLDRIATTLLELGDREFYYYTSFLKTAFLAFAGDPVEATHRALAELSQSIRRAGHRYPEPELFLRPYSLLISQLGYPLAIEEELRTSEAEVAAERGTSGPYVRTAWLLVLSIYNRWDLAFAQSEILHRRILSIVPFVHVAHHTFYRGLAAAVLAADERGRARRRKQRVVRECLRRLRRWQLAGPDFVHMTLMLEAEQQALAGAWKRAAAMYTASAKAAAEAEFPHHEALAHERCARLYIRFRRTMEASAPLARSVKSYGRWGCRAKAEALAEEFDALYTR